MNDKKDGDFKIPDVLRKDLCPEKLKFLHEERNGIPSSSSIPEYLREPVELKDGDTLMFSIDESEVALFDPNREDEYGAASRSALTAYSQAIRKHDSKLSTAINKMIDSIQKKLGIWEGPKEDK